MTEESKIYLENLNAMRSVVTEMKSMQDPDVDKLVPLTEKGLAARNNCLQRIEFVEKSLGLSEGNSQ
jgi:hypothetical protein